MYKNRWNKRQNWGRGGGEGLDSWCCLKMYCEECRKQISGFFTVCSHGFDLTFAAIGTRNLIFKAWISKVGRAIRQTNRESHGPYLLLKAYAIEAMEGWPPSLLLSLRGWEQSVASLWWFGVGGNNPTCARLSTSQLFFLKGSSLCSGKWSVQSRKKGGKPAVPTSVLMDSSLPLDFVALLLRMGGQLFITHSSLLWWKESATPQRSTVF